jgi:hypothetical protein
MNVFAHIKRCLELSDRDVASAVADRRMAKALLDQLAKVSRPGDGAPKLLLVFAKMASSEVDWIDGALRVEMVGDGDVTVVEVLSELGFGMRERVFASFKMGVPLEEFARAVERVPHMIAPLAISTSANRRLVLSAAGDEETEEEASSAAPVSIDDDSLYTESTRRRPSTKPRTGKTLRPGPPEAPPRKHPSTAPRAPMGTLLGLPPVATLSANPPPKIARMPPALPGAEARTAIPALKRSVVAKVPLTKVQVRRGSRPPPAVERAGPASRPPKKRASTRPPPKGQSKPPERHSKGPQPHSGAPRAMRGRAAAMSEPPDEEAIDTGWDDTDK